MRSAVKLLISSPNKFLFRVFDIGKKALWKSFKLNTHNEQKQFQKYLTNYTTLQPNDSNPFALFENCWSSKVPNVHNTGSFDGFNDNRIEWLIDEIGDLTDKSVLELGPLEAAHTYMLEKAGAKVTAIEGNYGAFFRCLTVKNLLGLRAKFTLGDFSKFEPGSEKFDTIVACGILYHMSDPVGLLKKLSGMADNIFIWTHYFEEDLEKWSPMATKQLNARKWDLENIETHNINGINIRTVRQNYGKALGWGGFCGGNETFSYWIFKQDLLKLLKSLGFVNIRIPLYFDQVDHQHGPCFAVLASKVPNPEKIDVDYYLDPKINPDLHEEFGQLPSIERESKAIEHFVALGREEGRLPNRPITNKTNKK